MARIKIWAQSNYEFTNDYCKFSKQWKNLNFIVFWWEKILYKESNDLISVIWALYNIHATGFLENYVTWILEDWDCTLTNQEKLFFLSCEWRKKEMKDPEKNYQNKKRL